MCLSPSEGLYRKRVLLMMTLLLVRLIHRVFSKWLLVVQQCALAVVCMRGAQCLVPARADRVVSHSRAPEFTRRTDSFQHGAATAAAAARRVYESLQHQQFLSLITPFYFPLFVFSSRRTSTPVTTPSNSPSFQCDHRLCLMSHKGCLPIEQEEFVS